MIGYILWKNDLFILFGLLVEEFDVVEKCVLLFVEVGCMYFWVIE